LKKNKKPIIYPHSTKRTFAVALGRAIGITELQDTIKRGGKQRMAIDGEITGKYPNQRTITVNKEACNKVHLYTVNNIEALEEAMYRLRTKLGIKLYLYLAKNQDKHTFNFYSSDFCKLCRCSLTGYNSAFEELVKEGYLVKKIGTETVYSFYDKSQLPENAITIEINKEIVGAAIQEEAEVVDTFYRVIETPIKNNKGTFIF
jgi:hypothetical protein